MEEFTQNTVAKVELAPSTLPQATRSSGKYRHEHKYAIDFFSYTVLSQKLKLIMQPDLHAGEDGSYLVTSLYFDNCFDKALKEKLHGVSKREKFRLRYYGDDTENIFLEKKQKVNGLCLKTSEKVSPEIVRDLLDGRQTALIKDMFAATQTVATVAEPGNVADSEFAAVQSQPLLRELLFKMQTQLLRPKTIVAYSREAYTYPAGNVRITFDSNISTGLSPDWFFEPDKQVLESPVIIMEVKYDEFLPDMIRHAVQPHATRLQAFSKYASARTMA